MTAKGEDEAVNEAEENGTEEPNFSDPEDFVDDIADDELIPDLLKEKPKESDSTESVVIVDGVPHVGPERLPKLQGVLSKIFAKFGQIVRDFYPVDEASGETKGYVFLEFASRSSALEAAQVMNGYKLDKQHTFQVNVFSDLEKYRQVEEDWEAPKPRPYKDYGNLKAWLQDPDSVDQFAVQYDGGEKVAVMANLGVESANGVIAEKQRWTETTVRWSPRGTYLATFHQQGVALWGGEKFEQIQKFPHNGVQVIDFSPCETYLVTYAQPRSKYSDSAEAIKVWEVRTGDLKRSFPGAPDVYRRWPYFRWSSDDRFFASLKTDEAISIYETPSFGMLDKKSVKLDGVRDFQWCSADPILSYWVAERGEVPARVAVMKVPDKVDIRSKNLFNVAEAQIHWQKSGDYLCVKVDRYGKKKVEKEKEAEGSEVKYTGMTYNLEIFHLRQKEIPVDTLEVKETVQAVSWEPKGDKLCVIHGELKFNVSFYAVKTGITPLKTLELKSNVNTVFWAPSGQFLVLAAMKAASSGHLAFVDSSDMSVMNTQEHPGLTEVEWDPTGRYVMTAVSAWSGRGDYGYMLWNFQGRLLQRKPMERFCQFLWRPRPPSLLPESKVKEVKKNMKKYAAAFEEKDRQMMSKASKEITEKRQGLKGAFHQWLTEKRAEWKKERAKRLELRDGVDTDQLFAGVEMLEETIEYLIEGPVESPAD